MKRRAFLASLSAAPFAPARAAGRARTIAFLTDIHARTEWETPKAMALAAEKIRAAKPDLVICGGDLITDGFTTPASALGPRWEAWRAMREAIGQPVAVCLGNHDLVGVEPDDGSPPEKDPRRMFREQTGLERTWYHLDAAGLRVFVLDSLEITGGNEKGQEKYRGWVNEEQLAWLRRTLEDTPADRELILVTHIPLHIASTDILEKIFKTPVPSPGRIVGNAAEVMALFRGRPLRAVLQGHLHFNEHTVKDGIPHIIGGAVCAKFWRGAWHNTEEGFGLLRLDGDRHEWTYVDMGWEAKRP